jgi:hypothetical protein
MKPSTGAAVRLHRNAVRDRPESLSAFKWNACPPSPEYAQDGKDHRLSRRRCHYCVCSDLLAILAERAQMTPKRPRDTNQIAKDESK